MDILPIGLPERTKPKTSNLTGSRHWRRPRPVSKRNFANDQSWQTNAKGITTENYDGGKGLELIPFEKVEVIFQVLRISRTTIPRSGTDSAMLRSSSNTGCSLRTRNMGTTS